MTDTAMTQARLAAIKKAMHSGVLTVRHGDTTTTFRSLAEMQAIIADLEKDLAGPRTRLRYAYQSGKGL